jgi:hypothetical protein
VLAEGLAMENLGDIDAQSIARATSTGKLSLSSIAPWSLPGYGLSRRLKMMALRCGSVRGSQRAKLAQAPR